jgi:hypothetical protein
VRRGLALLVVAALGTAGTAACANTFDATKLGVPVSMAAPAGEVPAGNRFAVTGHAIYGLWGLLQLHEPSLQHQLAAQLADGTGVADLRIRVRSRWTDLLITALTLGVVTPRSVTFEGVITEK